MNLITINDFWKKKGLKTLIKPLPVSELEFPYISRNGYDSSPPFIFIQNNLFIEIWNIGVYTDYQHTWKTGLSHFTYTIRELLCGEELKIIEIKNHRKERIFKSLSEFRNEWINEYSDYKPFVKEIAQ